MTHRGPFQPRPFCDSVILRSHLRSALGLASCGLRVLFVQSPDSHICLRHLLGRFTNPSWLGALCPQPRAARTWRGEGGGTGARGASPSTPG